MEVCPLHSWSDSSALQLAGVVRNVYGGAYREAVSSETPAFLQHANQQKEWVLEAFFSFPSLSPFGFSLLDYNFFFIISKLGLIFQDCPDEVFEAA